MIDSMVCAWFWPILAAPFVGSFMGVLIMRLPSGNPVVLARSACSACGTRLAARDLIPLVSFIGLKGRCRYCRQTIGLFHHEIEFAAVGVAVWALLADPEPARVWLDCGLGWTLLTLAWIDCTSFLLPDLLTLPLLLAGLFWVLFADPGALADHSIAAVIAYLSFQGIAFAYRRLRGWNGLGGGDSKLIAAAGAWCGLGLLPYVIFCAAVVGLFAALGLAMTGSRVTATTRIPFGPCIALAFWLSWLYGELLRPLAGSSLMRLG